MPGKGGRGFADEDFEDEDDWEDDYEEEEEDWDEPPPKPNQQKAGARPGAAPPKAGAGAPAGGGGAAGSKLAHYLVSPPPRQPNGKVQSGAKKEPTAMKQQQQPYPVAPPRAAPSAGSNTARTQPFDFNAPSPDDVVSQAQQGRSVGPGTQPSGPPRPSPTKAPTPASKLIHLPESKAMQKPTPKQQQQQQQQQGGGANGVAAGMAGLSVQGKEGEASGDTGSGGAATTSTAEAAAQAAAQRVTGRRRMAEYTLEPDLARECAAAASAEQPEASTSGTHPPPDSSSMRKPGLHLVVLGHVDAGKSTLMGRLLYELGQVPQKDVHKNQREAAIAGKASFSWAWLLDERPEERSRGVTVDVATTRFQTPRFVVTLLDAPGHRDFVPNMIGGAAAADAALLLVDGSPGGFEAGFEAGEGCGGGQTREHAQLARSLGVEQLVVVVSKLDMSDQPQERFEHIRATLAPFLQSSCGFRPQTIQWLPAVGPSGQNLIAPPNEPALSSWWKGQTLTQAIDAFKPRERLIGKPLRVPVSDVFKNKAGALMVGGKVEAGALHQGSKVLVVPGQALGSIRAIEVGGQPASLARAGDAAELAVAGLDVSSIPSGAVLCHPEFPVPLATKFELRVVVLEVPVPVLKGQSVTIHAHVAREVGHVSGLLALMSPRSGEVTKNKPRCLLKGQTALVEVTCPRGLCLEEYADLKPLGRVALRDGGRTLAVGVVTCLLA